VGGSKVVWRSSSSTLQRSGQSERRAQLAHARTARAGPGSPSRRRSPIGSGQPVQPFCTPPLPATPAWLLFQINEVVTHRLVFFSIRGHHAWTMLLLTLVQQPVSVLCSFGTTTLSGGTATATATPKKVGIPKIDSTAVRSKDRVILIPERVCRIYRAI